LAANLKSRGDESGEAAAYHQLGRIAEEQRDFAAAGQWYRKSLAIKGRLGNEHGAAITYAQLGMLAGIQENYLESGQWLIKSILAFLRAQDRHSVAQAKGNFMISYNAVPAGDQEKLKAMWQEAGLGSFPPRTA